MDPLEEFEFKPLTEGLGFHRKKIDLGQEMKKSGVVKNTIVNDPPPAPRGLNPDQKILKSPLPTKAASAVNSAMVSSSQSGDLHSTKSKKDVIDDLVQSFRKPNETFEEGPQKSMVILPENNLEKSSVSPSASKTQSVWVLSGWDIAPFLIDLMMVLSLFLFGMIVSLYVTKVDVYEFLFNPANGIEEYITIPAILFSMIMSYTLITRIFINGTLGEKVFDMQLGSPEDTRKFSYSIKVMLRMFVVVCTGFIILPFLSLIFRRDLAGKISRLSLYRSTKTRVK